MSPEIAGILKAAGVAPAEAATAFIARAPQSAGSRARDLEAALTLAMSAAAVERQLE